MRFLILDDSESDRLLAIREIRKGFPDAEYLQVNDEAGFVSALAREDLDVVVTDYRMGWLDGLEALRRVKARHPHVPVLMLTGTGGEEVAVEAMKEGVDDYLLKSQLNFDRLPRAVAAAVERKRQRVELARAERRYGELFRSVPVGLCRCDAGNRIIEANPAVATLLDADLAALPGRQLAQMIEQGEAAWQAALSGEAPEVTVRRAGGKRAWAVLRIRPSPAAGNPVYECALADVTENHRSADERNALLGELYHRVNNTLQMLIGMVNAQAARIADPGTREVLTDLAQRIHAVSLVQHRLYEAERFTEVDFAEFLRDLVASLALGPEPRVRLDLASVTLPVARAIPLGLAANEILTNCLKHAFPDGRPGEIVIRLSREAGNGGADTLIDIADDGIGMASGKPRREGYGTRLLGLLMRQAEAEMEVHSKAGEGTRIGIRFRSGA